MESASPRVVSCLYSVSDPTWQQIWVGQMIFFQPIYVSLFYIRLDSSLKEIKPLGYHFSSRFVGQLASIVEQTVKTKVGEWKTSHGVALWQKQKQQHKLRQRTETIELQTGTPFRQYLIKLSAVEREVCIRNEAIARVRLLVRMILFCQPRDKKKGEYWEREKDRRRRIGGNKFLVDKPEEFPPPFCLFRTYTNTREYV